MKEGIWTGQEANKFRCSAQRCYDPGFNRETNQAVDGIFDAPIGTFFCRIKLVMMMMMINPRMKIVDIMTHHINHRR